MALFTELAIFKDLTILPERDPNAVDLYECRACGSELARGEGLCPACGSAEIARYDL